MIVGFTGTRDLLVPGRPDKVAKRLDELASAGMTTAVTGACHGVDAFIVAYLGMNHPMVRNVVVVPALRSQVSIGILDRSDVELVLMPAGTTYRDRNTKIVELAETVEAFWTGQFRSGTNMTIGIARRAGKLGNVTML
jgi:hypothetical protein